MLLQNATQLLIQELFINTMRETGHNAFSPHAGFPVQEEPAAGSQPDPLLPLQRERGRWLIPQQILRHGCHILPHLFRTADKLAHKFCRTNRPIVVNGQKVPPQCGDGCREGWIPSVTFGPKRLNRCLGSSPPMQANTENMTS